MMGISLISPAGSNFIKDFPDQNSINMDRIDEFAGPCLTSHGLTPYVPQLTAVTTNPTLGDGSIVGYYYRIFDQIFAWGQFRFGTGFAVGSGIYMMSLPFAVQSIIGPSTQLGTAPIIGNGSVFDSSAAAGRQPVVCALRTSTQVQFVIRTDSGMAARECTSANIPITWAVDDGISFSVRYKRQP